MPWQAEAARDTISWWECFPAWLDVQFPGIALAEVRTEEGLTQVQLACLTGIPQRHIFKMEHGKRSIGKERAKKLSEGLKVDYHVFLQSVHDN